MARKEISGDRVGFGNYFGTAMMCLTNCIAASLMTSWFMQYLTDYAGLGTFGAVMGTVLLFVMRIFDAVNDPLEGWIMDKAKVGKHGKLMIAPRMLSMIIGMVCGSIISIVNGVNANIGNMHTAFGVTVLADTVVCMVLSLIGVIFVNSPTMRASASRRAIFSRCSRKTAPCA